MKRFFCLSLFLLFPFWASAAGGKECCNELSGCAQKFCKQHEFINKELAVLEKKGLSNGAKKAEYHRMAEKYILPFVDFDTLSEEIALEKWDKAGPADRAAFKARLKKHLLKAYLSKLPLYQEHGGKMVDWYEPQGEKQKKLGRIVSTKIDGPSTKVKYNVSKPFPACKVFDITANGVSVVITEQQSREVLGAKTLNDIVWNGSY